MVEAHKKLSSVRIKNLRQLLTKHGSVVAVSKRLNISPIHIYSILQGKTVLRDAMARKIELACLLPPGALDESLEKSVEEVDVPMLSLTQRITQPVEAKRYVDGKAVNVAKAHVSAELKEELVLGVLDNLEQLAQNKGVSLLNQQKAYLFKLAIKRLLSEDAETRQ